MRHDLGDIEGDMIRSDEGLTLETSAFRISVRWPIYIINSVDKTKFLYTTSPPTQHHSFFRNYPFIHLFLCVSLKKLIDVYFLSVSFSIDAISLFDCTRFCKNFKPLVSLGCAMTAIVQHVPLSERQNHCPFLNIHWVEDVMSSFEGEA